MINKDINRLKYTFSRGYKPNENDVEALNNIIKYVNKEKERDLNNYHLFAKLYINAFKSVLISSEGNYLLASKSIKSILQIDLDDHLNRLIDEANIIFLENELKNAPALDNFVYPKWDKKKMKDRIIEVINDLIEDYG